MARTTPHFAWVSLLTAALITIGLTSPVEAGPFERGSARTSVNHAPAPHAQPAQRPNVSNNSKNVNNVNAGNRVNSGNNNRVGNTTNINNSHNTVNNNVNVNRDVNVNVEGNGHYGYDDHYHHNDDYHPIATAAAVTATVAVTAAVVGSIMRPAQMPTSCVQVIHSGVAYMQCGSTWYQPQYAGSDVTYVVINAPY